MHSKACPSTETRVADADPGRPACDRGAGLLCRLQFGRKSPCSSARSSPRYAVEDYAYFEGLADGNHSPRTRNGFCTLARKTGIADIEVAGGSAHADTTTLLRGIDRLDAGAPAEIKSDFHAFDELEHTIFDPSGGTPARPGSNLAAAMAHVSGYLSDTCRLG